MNHKNILFIGFMGVGKGTIARELAMRTALFAVDTDDLIESFSNRKIRTIFKEEGELYFRNLEKRVAIWLEHHVANSIISTGGGFVAVNNLNSIGTVVFLQLDFETILAKMMNHAKVNKKIKKRPLFQDLVKIRELFATRQPLYLAKADIIINLGGKSTLEAVDELYRKLTI